MFWLVRPGARGEIAPQVHEQAVVAVGWALVGDIGGLASLDDVRERLLDKYSGLSPQQVGFRAGQLFTFLHRMADGDIVLVPVPLERKVWLGKVRGAYLFDADVISIEYPHVRPVTWLREVPYEAISPKLRASIETPRAVFSLKSRASEVRRLVDLPPELTQPQVYELPRERLTRVHFERFKAFDERVQVDVEPVTLIAGINSSGKTAILQSLLLARQTLLAPYRGPREDALKYDADLVSFADFSELIFGKPTSMKARMRLGFTAVVRADSYAVHEYFGNLPQDAGRLNMSVELDAEFGYDKGQGIVVATQIVVASRIRHAETDYRGPALTIEPEGPQWRLSLVEVDGKVRAIVEDILTVNRFIPVWEIRGRPRAQTPERRHIYDTFRSLFAPGLETLRQELENRLFYVGPLRSGPQRTYVRQGVPALDVGPGGEAAVQLLYENWGRQVDFVSLPRNLTDIRPGEVQPAPMPLEHAVGEALRLLGMGQKPRIKKWMQSYAAEFSLLSKRRAYASIMHVGFGLNQILPIVAVSLLSPVESILIFEQPEIHLHPRAQAGLAEFFLCLARTGRRVLVETHSDHLINRLRRRVAEDESGELQDSVNILFVQPPEAGNQGARVRTGRIGRYGEIEDWPPGFLAEGALDARAILLAAAAKRLRDRNQEQAR